MGAYRAGVPDWTPLDLTVRNPFDGAGLAAFLALRAVPGVEVVDGSRYLRSAVLPGGPAVLRIELDEPAAAALLSTAGDRPAAQRLVRRLVDADHDPYLSDSVLAQDPRLADSVDRVPGIRLPGTVDGAEILVRAILGQQVSVAAARTACARLAQRWGEPLPGTLRVDGVDRLFPAPAALAGLTAPDIPGPGRRAESLIAAARDLATGDLVLAGRTVDELTADIVARPGLGPWTAGYVAVRVLGATDVLLVGDLALRGGARRLGLPDQPRALAAHGARWAPFRSYAGLHLWRAAATPAQTDVAPAPDRTTSS